MSILIVGADGSMGKRYQAILKHLGRPFIASDVHTPKAEFDEYEKKATGIIISTPTDTHIGFLERFKDLGVPVLCEKPLSKRPEELDQIRKLFKGSKSSLTMTMQYKMLDDPGSSGQTQYNYFRHGNDGLKWDCIQLIGLARSEVFLDETSPVWQCFLNGRKLNLSDMDVAYVQFVLRWLERPGDDVERLIDIHYKVINFGKEN